MKGGSDYCLINTERIPSFTATYPLGNLPEPWVIHGPSPPLRDPMERLLIKHLYLFLSTFTGSFFFKVTVFFCPRQPQQHNIFPRSNFLCVIIIINEVGRTRNSPYLKQTLVVTALSSHCAEESPTNRTPSHLSLRPCRLGGSGSIKEEHSR